MHCLEVVTFFKAKPRSGLSTSHMLKLEQLGFYAVEDWKCIVQQENECQLEEDLERGG